MAKFTASIPLNIRLPGGEEVSGAAGTTHRISDALVEEFTRDVVPSIPGGVSWITQDETSNIPTLPIAESDVTGLVTDLAGKAASVHTHAESSVTGLTTDISALSTSIGSVSSSLTTKLPLAGGTMSGPITFASTQDRVTQVINVKARGVTGNGTTDDTAAIQAILNSAGLGAVVYFPIGTYVISSVLSIPLPMTLVGDGGHIGASVITQGTINTGALSVPAAGSGTVLRGLMIKGNGVTAGRGVFSQNDVIVHDIRVQSFYDGLYLGTGSFYSRVILSTFISNANAGVFVANCYNTLVEGCRIQNNAYGLWASNFTTLRLIACSIEQNTQQGLRLDGTSSNFVLDGLYFESAVGTVDIYLGPSATVTGGVIRGCTFISNSVASYWHIDSYNMASLSIIGCNVQTTGAGGGPLRTSSSTDLTLSSNTMAGTASISGSYVSQGSGIARPSVGLALPVPISISSATIDLTLTTAYADVAGLAQTFTAAVSEYVDVEAVAYCGNEVAGNDTIIIALVVDTTQQLGQGVFKTATTATGAATVAQHWVIPITAGAHTFKLQAKKITNAGTSKVYSTHTTLRLTRWSQ